MEEGNGLGQLSGRQSVGHGEADGTASSAAQADLAEDGQDQGGGEGLRDEAQGCHDTGADAHHGDRVAYSRRLHRAHGGDAPDAEDARGDVGDLVHVVKAHALGRQVAADERRGRDQVKVAVLRRIRWPLLPKKFQAPRLYGKTTSRKRRFDQGERTFS